MFLSDLLTLRTVVLIKSDKDNRYGLDSVVTHDGTKMACWAVSELSSFHDKLGIEAYDKVQSNTSSLNIHAYILYYELYWYTPMHIFRIIQIDASSCIS